MDSVDQVNGTIQAQHDENDEHEYWRAVQQKDKTFDGQFIFAVKTTGIYCRPSCPAKTAKRDNVLFFATTQAAVAAGYRACKRCKPDGLSLGHAQTALIQDACATIAQSPVAMTLATLAANAGISAYHFHRLFKEHTGITPKSYQTALLKARMKSALDTSQSVTNAIYDAGFSSSGRFYASTNAMLGMSPQRYKQEGKGMEIRYVIQPCSLGFLLVAATPVGICAIEFDDAAQALEARLRQRFSQAHVSTMDDELSAWLSDVLAFIEHPASLLKLPLDVQGTVFQHRVWKALQKIPVGTTVSYTKLAAQIGQPTAARAVASACASNQIAVAIPCHRVVRADGSLSGYRWGIERKDALLKRESGLNNLQSKQQSKRTDEQE